MDESDAEEVVHEATAVTLAASTTVVYVQCQHCGTVEGTYASFSHSDCLLCKSEVEVRLSFPTRARW